MKYCAAFPISREKGGAGMIKAKKKRKFTATMLAAVMAVCLTVPEVYGEELPEDGNTLPVLSETETPDTSEIPEDGDTAPSEKPEVPNESVNEPDSLPGTTDEP